MQQVGKVKFMYKYIFLAVLIVFTGCATKEEYTKKKIYKGYSKDAVLEATKKVFLLADRDKQFQINSFRNKVEVVKPKFYYNVVHVGVYLDTWVIEVVQEENQVRAFLDLKRTEVIDENKNLKIHKDINTKIFWNRLEYLLGINKKWDDCRAKLSLFTSDSLLCDDGVLFDSKPKAEDMVKNPLIIQRPKRLYTVDTIDADVYKFTDISIKKNKSDIFEQNSANNKNVDPILEDKADEQENVTNDKTIEEKAEEDLQKLKSEMGIILDKKENIDDMKIDTIIDSEEIIENSEIILDDEESTQNTSEDKLDKLEKIEKSNSL